MKAFLGLKGLVQGELWTLKLGFLQGYGTHWLVGVKVRVTGVKE
jgi:hypothetical protein